MAATIGIIIDLIIIAVLLIFGLIGLKKGFFKSILSVFSFATCLFIAIWAAKYVANWINGLYDFSNLIGNKISKSLMNSNEFFALPINTFEATGKDALIASIPNTTNGIMVQIIKAVFSSSSVNMSSTDSIGYVVGSSLGDVCMIVIAGIVVFIVLKIALSLLTRFFDNMCKTKAIGGLNKIFGLILGLIKGALIVFSINFIVIALTLIPFVNRTIPKFINNNTYVERGIYKASDKLFEKFIIDGDMFENKIEDLWNKR